MTVAELASERDSPRMRVHSFAVWTTVVFMLNVLAFLLMGMQARQIFGAMSEAALVRAGWFAAAVVAAVIGIRLVIAFAYRGFILWRSGPNPRTERLRPAETLLIGWTGMRGLVTMATAFALPADFPERGTAVLTAFAVVLATLVIQGLSLVPLIRWFGIEREDEQAEEREQARAALADAALARLADEPGDAAEALRAAYRDVRAAAGPSDQHRALDRRHGLALAAILAERKRLEELRANHAIGPDRYLELQEDLDWKQLAVIGDEDRRIDES
jgi:CPA1 family monovalent cation:H+ antiporter